MTLSHAQLVDRVRDRLVASGGEATPAAVVSALQAEGRLFGDAAVLEVVSALQADLVGLGPLQPLLADLSVTDVLVNGHDAVWVDRGEGLEQAAVGFPDDAAVRRLAQRLAASTGRRLDDAVPYVDARLPGGVRLHAVLPPVAERPTLSLRVVRPRGFALDDLVRAGSLPEPVGDLLRRVVASRVAFLVTGGTGSGKTTLLGALLGLVPAGERIVVVEDTGELVPDHHHVVRLQARPPNVEGAGEVTLRDLVRQALRMRPDRLVVGEVRGAEVVDLMAALNTGHQGGCGTLHANAPAQVPARVEALAAAAGMRREASHSQLGAALQVVVHLERLSPGRRVVGQLAVVTRSESGLVEVVAAVRVHDRQMVDGPARRALDALLAQAPG